MRVLGVETSCDETGVALYEAGRRHPGRAAREPDRDSCGLRRRRARARVARPHREAAADGSGRAARGEARARDLDAIAYTAGPGLIGALMVGGSFASSLAYALKIPAIPVHHLEGHLLACMLEDRPPEFPFLALLVSGGHSQLIEVAGVGRYRIVGETLDDAAGEAFDKVARLLGLPYPGGPELAALAERGDRASGSRCRGR